MSLGPLRRNESDVKADEKEQPVQERETYFLDILKSYSDKLTASSNGWFLLWRLEWNDGKKALTKKRRNKNK